MELSKNQLWHCKENDISGLYHDPCYQNVFFCKAMEMAGLFQLHKRDLLTYCKWDGKLAMPLTCGNVFVYFGLETANWETWFCMNTV